MVVHYPRTVWKNSYAKHKETGKTYHKEQGGQVDVHGEVQEQIKWNQSEEDWKEGKAVST